MKKVLGIVTAVLLSVLMMSEAVLCSAAERVKSSTQVTATNSMTSYSDNFSVSIKLNGAEIKNASVSGSTLTVSYNLTAPKMIRDGELQLGYDSSKLSLRSLSMPVVKDDAIYNTSINPCLFSFSSLDGYDFRNGNVFVKAEFNVKSGASGEAYINLIIDELGAVDANDYYNSISYFTDGTVTAEGYVILSSLINPTVEYVPQVTGLKSTAATQNSVSLSWNSVGISGARYSVEYKPSSSSSWTSYTNTTSTYTTISGLSAGTTYNFRVRAYANGTYGAYSSTVSATTLSSVQPIEPDGSEMLYKSPNGIYPVVSEVVNSEPNNQVNTKRYYFYFPDYWKNTYNDNYYNNNLESCCLGIYWWSVSYSPDNYKDKNTKGWPGYRILKRDSSNKNIFYADIPEEVKMVIFNNMVDSGFDPEADIWGKGYQTVNILTNGFTDDDYGYYEYLDSTENMIYVVNPDDETVNEYSGARYVKGDWFYYYGNGKYGTYASMEQSASHNDIRSNGAFYPDTVQPTTPTTPTQSPSTVPQVTGLKITRVTAKTVSLDFNPISISDIQYVIERKTDSSSWTSYNAQTYTSTILSNLTPNTTYYFRVRAVLNGEYGAYSSTVTATTLASDSITVPRVTGLKVTGVTKNSVSLSWDSINISGVYYMYHYRTESGNWGNGTTISDNSVTITGLSQGTTYYFYVEAWVDGVFGEASSTVSATTLSDQITIPQVTGLKSTGTTTDSVSLSWNSVGISGARYYVEYKPSSSSSWTSYTNTTSTYTTVSGLSAGTLYDFRVRAFANGSYGEYSSEVEGHTVLPKVTGLKVTSVTANSISISWDSLGHDVEYYAVCREKIGSFTTNETMSTSTTFTGLKPETTYTLFVQATNNYVGFNDSSEEVTATTQSSAQPTTPTTPTQPPSTVPQVTGLKVTNVTSDSISLSWNSVGISGAQYEVDAKLSSTDWVDLGDTTNTSVTFTDCSPDTTYYFRVRACVNSVYGDYSSTISVTTQSDQTTVPQVTGMKILEVTEDSIAFTYDAINISGVQYCIEQKTDSSSWKAYDPVTFTTPEVTGLQSGTKYYFRVRALVNGVYGAYSSTISATTNSNNQTRVNAWADKSTIYVGASTEVYANVSNGSGYTLFTSSNTSVATVTSDGVVTGKKAGVVVITVKNNGVSSSVKIKVIKRANPMTVKAKTITAKVKKKTVFSKAKAFTIKKAKGKVVFKKTSGNSKITVTSAGKVTVNKGLKKGTYNVKVKVTAKGNTTYNAKSKTVTLKVRVK